MLKVSTFAAQNELGYTSIPLFGSADREFEKTASPYLLPPVLSYIEGLRPRNNSQYVLVNAMGAGEWFGCFPAGTLVETSTGEKPIEVVDPGEQVLTHKNRFRRVVARTPKLAEELCDLYVQGLPSNLPALTATPNHELWVVTRDDFVQTKRRVVWKGDTFTDLDDRREQALQEMEFSWVPISELRAGDYIAEPFPLDEDPTALGDEKWNCIEIAFLMGLYAAEGCTVSRAERPGEDHYVVFVISHLEEHTLQHARDGATKFGYKLYEDESPETHSIRLELHWQEFARLCRRHVGKLAHNKKLSPAMLRMPRGWQRVFWAAYRSGDGCVRGEGKEEGAVRVVSASASLLRGVRLLLARSGLVASISGRHNKKATWYTGKPIYELALSAGQIRGRGTPKSYLHPDGYILSSVKKVEQYSWQGEVYDLTVEEDSSFVASGVAVHNSNINGDHFPEAALIHTPPGATGNPVVDRAVAKKAAYGYLTFYNAHPFAHHRNKDPSRAYGEVELSAWNDTMKRVELVVRVDFEKCQQFGGTAVWDKLKSGQFPDVSMGCLPAGSMITMGDGTRKPIELVQESEWVLTHTGQRRRVTETMRRPHEGSIFRIKAYGFRRELLLTGNHPLWLVDGEQLRCSPVSSSDAPWTTRPLVPRQRHCTPFVREQSKGCSTCSVAPTYAFDWKRADEAQVGDYLAFPIPDERSHELDSSDLAKFLGYYLAEGHVGGYNERPLEQITFSLNYEEREIAAEIERLGRALGASVVWHHEVPEAGARSVSVVSKNLARRCLEWCGAGAKTKALSREVLYAHPDLLLVFLGAYLDGDGGTYKGSAYFSTASEVLSHQLLIALARCGMIASVNEIEHKPSEKSVVRKDTVEYQVWVGTDFSWKMAGYTRKPVRRSKKVRGQRFFYERAGVRYLMTPIVEIHEDDYKDDVFNFSVDQDESYVAEGLAVHNSKVPYDTSSITLDWKLYREAQATFDSKRHTHPGAAVLEFHKKLKAKDGTGIRGISITRNDYDEWCKNHMNRILPDGRKVFVYNDYPRFFDISFVFIGADRTAKTMVYIVQNGSPLATPSAKVAHALGYREPEEGEALLKVASVEEQWVADLTKGAEEKKSEIEKEVIPSQLAAKAVPVLSNNEPSLPLDIQDALASVPEDQALSSVTGMGMVLRPAEFQRITLIRMGCRPLADSLYNAGVTFPKVPSSGEDLGLDPDKFVRGLGRLLAPFMDTRSALGPFIEKRVLVLSSSPKTRGESASSHPSPLLRKIGSAYGAYREQLMSVVASSQDLIEKAATPRDVELLKVAHSSADEVFTPLSFCYLQGAFLDEASIAKAAGAVVETS